MKKYIVREVPAEWSDFGTYFDDDGLTERGGDYNYNLFIIQNDRWNRLNGFNMDEYRRVMERAESLLDCFDDIREGDHTYYTSYKEAMQYHGIEYSPRTCHRLKLWSEDADINEPADIAEFLTITTGECWKCSSAQGYSQGDYCEVVACEKHYENPVAYGEVWLGAATEYGVITLDDDGEEIESVFGYIVADCESYTDERTKELVCDWAGIDPSEATLELVDGQGTHTSYSYRIA